MSATRLWLVKEGVKVLPCPEETALILSLKLKVGGISPTHSESMLATERFLITKF